MAQESGFFNARLVGGEYDRVYLAEQFAAYFASFIGNGVFGNSMQQLEVIVANPPSMHVTVLPGQGWINGWWYRNTDNHSLAVSLADGILSRIDAVVLRWDSSARSIYLKVLEGTPSQNPVAPTISRNADYYDLQLCTISIPAGSVKVTQAQITDTRLNNSVCGLVTGVVDQIDTSSLFSQFIAAYQEWKENQQADYEEWTDEQREEFGQFTDQFESDIQDWFDEIKGQISEDAAVRIQLEINDITANVSDIETHLTHLTQDYYDFKVLGWSVPDGFQVKNEVVDDNFIQNVGRIDLSTLSIERSSTYVHQFSIQFTNANAALKGYLEGYITCDTVQEFNNHLYNNEYGYIYVESGIVYICDSSAVVSTVISKLRGNYFYYGLLNPITIKIDGNEIINKILGDYTYIDKGTIISGKGVNPSDGSIVRKIGGYITDYIYISDISKLIVFRQASTQTKAVFLYDANKNFISGYYTGEIISVPSNARYLVLSSSDTNLLLLNIAVPSLKTELNAQLSQKADVSDVIPSGLVYLTGSANDFCDKNGFFFNLGGGTDVPTSLGYLMVIRSNTPDAHCRQMYFDLQSNSLYTRNKVGYAWSAWAEIATRKLESTTNDNQFTINDDEIVNMYNSHPFGHDFFAVAQKPAGYGARAFIIVNGNNDYSIQMTSSNQITVSSNAGFLWLKIERKKL